MILVEGQFGLGQILFDLGLVLPGHRNHPIDVAAHHGGFGGHRRHHLELAQLAQHLLLGLSRHARLFHLLFQTVELIRRLFELTELFLDRLHLFVEIVLALALLHLLLDARPDALLNLQQIHLRLHHGHQEHEAFGDLGQLQNFLFVFNLERHVGRHGVSQTSGIINRGDRCQHLRRDLLVELDVTLKLTDGRTDQNFLFLFGDGDGLAQSSLPDEEATLLAELLQLGPLGAFNQNLDGAIRQLQQLQYVGDGADPVKIVKSGLISSRLFLGHQQNAFFLLHGCFQAANGFFAPDKQRDDHVRIDHHITQW